MQWAEDRVLWRPYEGPYVQVDNHKETRWFFLTYASQHSLTSKCKDNLRSIGIMIWKRLLADIGSELKTGHCVGFLVQQCLSTGWSKYREGDSSWLEAWPFTKETPPMILSTPFYLRWIAAPSIYIGVTAADSIVFYCTYWIYGIDGKADILHKKKTDDQEL